jgi:hypothetical protein
MARFPWTLLIGASVTALAPGLPAAAQVLPVRTVPVASGDQFLMLPSQSMGMGGVTLAIDDPLADAWSNPAKGALVAESAFLGSPTFYAISSEGGGGRTLPIAGLFTAQRWFGGVALALQEVEDAPQGNPVIWGPAFDAWGQQQRRLSDAFGRNVYASGYVGARLGGAWSIGLGLSASALDAMDGVDLLYADADRIEQSGGTQDARLGLHRQGRDDRVSLVVLHSRVSMAHDVTYTDWAWDSLSMWPLPRVRVELNEDKSRTWGTQLEWERALATPGWRVGASATVNRKTHPKIPNYEIQNIPRDPGTTWAYEAAVGFARETGPTTFALEVALQPIWSETWQEADTLDVIASDSTLAVGDRSIVNDFFFTNLALRTGLSHDVGRATFQAGLEVRSNAYTLEQVNHVIDSYREQEESWMEWIPTFGIAFRFTGLDVRYSGRVTNGTGRPGSDFAPDVMRGGLAETINQVGSADFILAPRGPLTLQDASVVTHQLSVRLPVR